MDTVSVVNEELYSDLECLSSDPDVISLLVDKPIIPLSRRSFRSLVGSRVVRALGKKAPMDEKINIVSEISRFPFFLMSNAPIIARAREHYMHELNSEILTDIASNIANRGRDRRGDTIAITKAKIEAEYLRYHSGMIKYMEEI